MAEEGGCCGCCYAMSMSQLKRVEVVMQGVCRGWGGGCHARSMSWLKRVDAVDAVMQGVCRG